MTKICQEEGCNKEIETWQTYCQQHYAMKMQGQQPQPAQSQVPEAPAELQPVVEEKVIDVKPEMPEQQVKQEQPLPQIDERTASIVSQVAFKGAIELVSNMAFEEKTYEELINEVRTLTNAFYRIIVEDRI